jgi:hypothetical protein
MIGFGLHGSKAGFDVSETFAIGELSKGHAEELIETGEGSDTILASIMSHTFVEFVFRQDIHELRKDDSPTVHWPFLSYQR